jgi:hypothetical protein
MSPALTAVLIALAQTDAGLDVLDVQTAASPKVTVDAEAGVDLLAANVVNTDPGAGDPAQMTAFELGLRALVHATAVDRHIHVDIDYQGRQPVGGNTSDSAIHLLNQAEVSADFLDKKVFVGLGRFFAPGSVLQSVDGLRAKLQLGPVELQVFGGRRAITSTRDGNVDFKTFLPIGGASASLLLPRLQAEIGASYGQDQVVVQTDTLEPTVSTIGSFSAYGRATVRPVDWLVAGAEVSTAQRASYLLGPTWNDVNLHVLSVDIFYAVFFLEVRPLKSLRVSYDFHFQNAALSQGGYVDPSTMQVVASEFQPRFIDNRVRIKWRPMALGWLGPEVRLRMRPDWDELRLGGFADLSPEWALGFCLRGSYTYEKMLQLGAALAPTDRSYWSASVGWRGRGLDLALGVSDVERSALPVSGRVYTPYNDTPDKPVDLSPFVVGAQRLTFLRAFWGNALFFAGVDFEQSLTDVRERRVFAQLGARLEKEW